MCSFCIFISKGDPNYFEQVQIINSTEKSNFNLTKMIWTNFGPISMMTKLSIYLVYDLKLAESYPAVLIILIMIEITPIHKYF